MFTEDEVKFMDEFGAFLDEHGVFKLTLKQAIDFNNKLVRFNTIRKKMYDHVMELKKSKDPPKPIEVKPEIKTKK